jgi:hypothetical protein
MGLAIPPLGVPNGTAGAMLCNKIAMVSQISRRSEKTLSLLMQER